MRIARASVIVHTMEYERKHGAKPSGNGEWVFEWEDVRGPHAGGVFESLHYTGFYRQGKSKAITRAARAGAHEIQVMP